MDSNCVVSTISGKTSEGGLRLDPERLELRWTPLDGSMLGEDWAADVVVVNEDHWYNSEEIVRALLVSQRRSVAAQGWR